jgi:hypothetical protein
MFGPKREVENRGSPCASATMDIGDDPIGTAMQVPILQMSGVA